MNELTGMRAIRLGAIAICGIVGCGDPAKPPVATTITVSPASASLASFNEEIRFTATVRDQNGDVMTDAAVAWSSGDESVATVSGQGLATAVGNGNTTVTASAGPAEADVPVTVEQKVADVSVAPAADTLVAFGDTVRLVGEARDANGHVVEGAVFSWESGNPDVAGVNREGLVTAVAEGTAEVTAAAGDVRAASVITVVSPVSPDRAVLTALYKATGGPAWTSRDNWLTDQPLSRWHGVFTNNDGRVTALWLYDNQLTGLLPAELGRLDRLEHLQLWGNRLTGPIPPELGNLASLRILKLDFNRLTGPIPPELGKLNSLRRLTLEGSGVSGPIPPELGNLAQLVELRLIHNRLTGSIPVELGDLPSVEALGLGNNLLTGSIPPELGNLATLRDLWLGSNRLTGSIPAELGKLANLESLVLMRNGLSGSIPPELGRLTKLRDLHLSSTLVSGSIPPELGNLANLEKLFMDANTYVTGSIPPELGRLTKLVVLSLTSNFQLTGPIPPELGNLARLERLRLNHNQLTGPIPPELGDLANLEVMSLSFNGLSGSIPPELGRLTKLRDLFLQFNDLSGSIPPELGKLASLERLILLSNRITGAIPPELARLTGLEAMLVSDNRLTGSVPATLGDMTSLRTLWVGLNPDMAGVLPVRLAKLDRLEAFLAGGTDLCAPSDTTFLNWLKGVREQLVARCEPPPNVYLTQAVQSREYPVELVAEERSLLRVFLVADRKNGQDLPAVRARFYREGRETYTKDIAAKSGPIPTELDESHLKKSQNAEIPGRVVLPDLELVIEVDPDGDSDSLDALGIPKRIPAEGRLAVDVRRMPVFDLTLVPFIWSEEDEDSTIVDIVEAIADDPEGHHLLRETHTLLPVHDLSVEAHEPVLTFTNDVFSVLYQTLALRAAEGGEGHYQSMMSPPVSGGAAGVAFAPGWVSFSLAYGDVMAHELGHNRSLNHAPCGGAGRLDPWYPYDDGSIGSWGYDFDGDSLIPASTSDLMAYCSPHWISDYSFNKAMRFRLADEGEPEADMPPERSLLLWGGADADGTPLLEPAFVVDAPPLTPRADGEYRIEGRTAEDTLLFSLSFDMKVMADGDGRSGFAFVLPVQPAWAESLAAITLSGPGGAATLDSETHRPSAIVRDPETGQVRAIMLDLPARITTPAAAAAFLDARPALELRFSRGIPAAAEWSR